MACRKQKHHGSRRAVNKQDHGGQGVELLSGVAAASGYAEQGWVEDERED